jgi:hypothetical protein
MGIITKLCRPAVQPFYQFARKQMCSSTLDGRTQNIADRLLKNTINQDCGKQILQPSRHLDMKQRKTQLTFEEYIQKHVETYQDYIKSSYVKEMCGTNTDLMKESYKEYCRSKYSEYKYTFLGGNPGRIV